MGKYWFSLNSFLAKLKVDLQCIKCLESSTKFPSENHILSFENKQTERDTNTFYKYLKLTDLSHVYTRNQFIELPVSWRIYLLH